MAFPAVRGPESICPSVGTSQPPTNCGSSKVGEPGGISPLGSHRSVRNSLPVSHRPPPPPCIREEHRRCGSETGWRACSPTREGWLAQLITPEWVRRCGRPVRYDRLPAGAPALSAYVEEMGADGMRLLQALYRPDAPSGLRSLQQCRSCGRSGCSSTGPMPRGDCAGEGPSRPETARATPRRSAGGDDDDKPVSDRSASTRAPKNTPVSPRRTSPSAGSGTRSPARKA